MNLTHNNVFMEPRIRRTLARLKSRKTALILTAACFMVYCSLFFMQPEIEAGQIAVNTEPPSPNLTLVDKIVNPYPYHFTMLSHPCTDEELVIAVHSAVKYHKRRMLMRNTWLNKRELENHLDMKVKVVFVTGASNQTEVQDYIEYEQELYGDIIQSNFIDSYQNNTFKALSYMRWVTSPFGCPNASLIFKVDDDALIHPSKMHLLNQTIHRVMASGHEDVYAGRLLTRLVNRDNTSKWYISYEVWPEQLYPVWFQGLVYMLTPHLAAKLYPIALRTTYMFTDDVYVGILVSKVPEAHVITINHLGTHADATQLSRLEQEYINGSQIFYHVPKFGNFYSWFIREDVHILDSKPIQKRKSPVFIYLFIAFSPVFLIIFLCCWIWMFSEFNVDDLASVSVNNKT